MSWLDLTNEKTNGTDRSPLPAGEHPAIVDEAEVVPTKSGRAIKAKFRVFEGENKGRLVWHYFNFENSSSKAQQIGRSQLKSYCLAAGLPVVLESVTDLMGRKLMISTTVEQSEGYGEQARIKGFKEYKTQDIPF